MKKEKKFDIDTDNIISPWEKAEIDKAKKLEKLQEEYFERQIREKEEKKKRKKLSETKITKSEKKKLEKEADAIKKLYVLDYWMRCFKRVSYCNEIAGQALFHVALGQALNNFKIKLEDESELDWRLHFCWLQNSGAGKGRAMNFVSRVMRHPNFPKLEFQKNKLIPRKYRCHKVGRMNAASLLNTYLIGKHGVIEKDENNLEKIKYGIMESNDFIFSEEARILLEGGRESMELQEIFMTAIETLGTINNEYTKTLTNYEKTLTTRCTASFALTTRPFGKIKKTLVESGMIPRFIFYARRLTFEDRLEMNKMSSFAFKTKKDDMPFTHDLNELIGKLNEVVKFANSNYIDFDQDKIDDLLSYLHEKMQWFTMDIENTIPSQDNRDILQTFVSRYKENMVKMAHHSAVMRLSKLVEKQDLQYAFDFFDKLYESQKIWVGLTIKEEWESRKEDLDMINEIEKIIKKDLNEILEKKELVKLLAKKFNKSVNTMYHHLNKYQKGGNPLIKEVKIKGDDGKSRSIIKLVD